MRKLILFFVLIPLMGLAQEKGTRFEHGLSWQQVKEKAKKENKFVLADCFTTWCGPCKYMTKTVFPQEKMGDFFNKNFVNVKVQIDKTEEDNDEVKSWYTDAAAIAKEFGVKVYPTFLIFSPEGELVHRIVGSAEADAFIAKAKKALDPNTQYYTLLKKGEENSSPEKLKQFYISAAEADDRENASKFADAYLEYYKMQKKGDGNAPPETLKELVAFSEKIFSNENAGRFANAYLATQKDLYIKENLELLSKYMGSSKSKGFEMILNNPKKVDGILGQGKANWILERIIILEQISPGLAKPNANIDSLIAVVKARYPGVDMKKNTDLVRVEFYKDTKNWPEFQTHVMSYMTQYGSETDAGLLTKFAWSVLANCKDPDCIAAATLWSKRSVEITAEKDLFSLDVYSALLYRTGKKDEAIAVAEKAVNLLPEGKRDFFQAKVDKMKKGI